ncbi:hypothetical protein C8F04DRAFT_1184199, partial [Mycena alexandri]
MNEDHDMTDARGTKDNPRRNREDDGEPQPKRHAVNGPTRETFEFLLRTNAQGKQKIEELEAQLAAATLRAEDMHNELLALSLEYQHLEEGQQTQFLDDQAEMSELATRMHEGQKLLMAQNETIQKLNREMADRTIENIEMKARLRAPSIPIARQRKGRAANFPVLRNIGTTVKIALDPVPLPDLPASSTENPQDSGPRVKTTITKAWTKPRKKKAEAPESRDEVTFWNNRLRAAISDKFEVKKYDEFMSHVPVPVREMKISVVPGENDWRWDFSNGYNESTWNIALRKKLVALVLEAQTEEITSSVDPVWLDEQLKKKVQEIRGIWGRLQRKPKADGDLETAAEAVARTAVVLEGKHMKKKSNSAKGRVRGRNGNCAWKLTRTPEVSRPSFDDLPHHRDQDPRGRGRPWSVEEAPQIVDRLGTIGMSSEEEDEADFHGKPTKIFKVKICAWRAPEIADYMRLVDQQSGLLAAQHKHGPGKVTRFPIDAAGTSRAPTGLPKCMYSREWLETLKRFEYEHLQVSEEEF